LLNGIRRKRLRCSSHYGAALLGSGTCRERGVERGRLAAVIRGEAANPQPLQSVTCFLPCAGVITSGADRQDAPLF
jgi:hypothetical protein